MRFLVTGASGFIGSNLALELQKSAEVVGLCSMNPGSKNNLKDFKGLFIQGDIRTFDYDSLGKFDAIFHQAAITDTTVTDPKLMISTNVEASKKILEFALRTACKKVIYASSAATYGKGKVPMSETDSPAPSNIYGESKVQMEEMTRTFCKEHPEISAIGLRYFNVYGPHEFHKNKAASMIYQLYEQIHSGKQPRVFKWGEQFRDFIYVKDVVLANLKSLKLEGCQVFNVGTGIPTSFNKVIEILNQTLGANKPTDYFDNPYLFYQNETQADIHHASKNLDFQCQYTPEEGIKDYVRYLKSIELKIG
jgi:ADP-L-glycero-D-manno-heptose 6-epimerase